MIILSSNRPLAGISCIAASATTSKAIASNRPLAGLSCIKTAVIFYSTMSTCNRPLAGISCIVAIIAAIWLINVTVPSRG